LIKVGDAAAVSQDMQVRGLDKNPWHANYRSRAGPAGQNVRMT
jgi:hypothetical protein